MLRQHELRECIRGTLGGLALAAQRGDAHMAAIGSAGGRRTRDRHGLAYLGALARRGAQVRWKRAKEPKTEIHEYAGLAWAERVIWYRHPNRRRRDRVVIVLWEREEVDDVRI